MIEHVTASPDAVHAASAPVVGYLAPDLESSLSAKATSNDDINEKLTSIINMFDSYREIFRSSSVALLHLLLPMQHPYKLLRNAADVHSSPLCLVPCRTLSSWLQTRGHLYDTPDVERVMVWTVYEMASFGRELGIPLPFLGCQQDALIGAYCGDASAWRAHVVFFWSIFVDNQVCCAHNSSPSTGSSFTVTAEREAACNVKEKRCARVTQ